MALTSHAQNIQKSLWQLIRGLLVYAIFLDSHHLLLAQPFDVLEFRSYGRNAVEFENKREVELEAYGILVDGEITSRSTGSVSYDRTLVTHTRVRGTLPVSHRFFIRPTVQLNPNMQKIEGKNTPRTIITRQWLELDGSLEMTFLAQSSSELFLGINARYVPSFESKTEAPDVKTRDKTAKSSILFPHLGVVKRSGLFEGGFYFVSGQDKARRVTRRMEGTDEKFRFDDHLYQSTTIAVFARGQIAGVRIFGEFAAVQAGEGGNRTDDGSSVEEDYIRFLVCSSYPLSFAPGLDLLTAITYKTLSYADNRNVTVQSMPMMGLQLGVGLKKGPFPAELNLIYVNGRDGQSLEEFNARYRVQGLGLQASVGFAF